MKRRLSSFFSLSLSFFLTCSQAFQSAHICFRHRALETPPTILQPSVSAPSFIKSIRCARSYSTISTRQYVKSPLSGDSSVSRNFINRGLQQKLQLQTLSRITIPSILAAAITYLVFPTVSMELATSIHDAFDGDSTGYGYETLNLILTDNSNQFIQNAHNAMALIFAFLTTNTLFFMYRQQETLYFALFEEITALISLLEQSALISDGREIYKILLDNIERYVEDDLKLVTDYRTIQGQGMDSTTPFSFVMEEMNLAREDLPALLLSRRPKDDPLEEILFVTSVGEPSFIYSTVRDLRQARAKRLGALQRKMPELNMYLLYTLGFTVWLSYPIVTAGAQTVGGEALIEVFRNQLSVGVFAMWGIFGIINELKRPEVASAYNVDYEVLGILLDGIGEELKYRKEKCGEVDTIQEMPYIVADADIKKPWVGRRIANILRKK